MFSTTNPTAMVSAISEILSRLKLSMYMLAKEPSKASGGPSAAHGSNPRGCWEAKLLYYYNSGAPCRAKLARPGSFSRRAPLARSIFDVGEGPDGAARHQDFVLVVGDGVADVLIEQVVARDADG